MLQSVRSLLRMTFLPGLVNAVAREIFYTRVDIQLISTEEEDLGVDRKQEHNMFHLKIYNEDRRPTPRPPDSLDQLDGVQDRASSPDNAEQSTDSGYTDIAVTLGHGDNTHLTNTSEGRCPSFEGTTSSGLTTTDILRVPNSTDQQRTNAAHVEHARCPSPSEAVPSRDSRRSHTDRLASNHLNATPPMCPFGPLPTSLNQTGNRLPQNGVSSTSYSACSSTPPTPTHDHKEDTSETSNQTTFPENNDATLSLHSHRSMSVGSPTPSDNNRNQVQRIPGIAGNYHDARTQGRTEQERLDNGEDLSL